MLICYSSRQINTTHSLFSTTKIQTLLRPLQQGIFLIRNHAHSIVLNLVIAGGQIAIVDQYSRIIGLAISQGIFKVIPIKDSKQGKINIEEGFNVRLDKLNVFAFCFLDTNPDSLHLAVLFQDTKDQRFIATYSISVKEKDINDAPGPLNRKVENGASVIIPAKGGGVIVVGEQSITYYSPTEKQGVSYPIQPTIIKR